jgi:hypothetical protein
MIKATLVTLPRNVKRLILVSLDTCILLVAVWATFVLRFKPLWPMWLQQRIQLLPLALLYPSLSFMAWGFIRLYVF